jgi:hypothetical protein
MVTEFLNLREVLMFITQSDIYDCQNSCCEDSNDDISRPRSSQSIVAFWVDSGYTSTRKASRTGDLPSQARLSVATSWGQEATMGPFTNPLL